MTELSATPNQAAAPCALCLAVRRVISAVSPVLLIIGFIIAIWYVACIPMNRAWIENRAGERQELSELVPAVWQQVNPVLPSPHQVWVEFRITVFEQPIMRERRGEMQGNPRNLLFHAYQTLLPTLLGFVIGSGLGIALAIGILHNRAMDLSVMPWAIASQMVPILAIAPMIIVVFNAIGITGLLPKALISSYLSFFPVVVGMVKGLRSPQVMDLDLMHTYSATAPQVLWKLRLPAALPFLFASLKVGVAASLVGAIVAELPTGARFGLGARLLSGSYYTDTPLLWSALIMAAICAASLVGTLGLIERLVLKRAGARP